MSGYEDLAGLVTLRPVDGIPPWDRNAHRSYSPFRAGFTATIELLAGELRRIATGRCVLELDMREQDFRLDGLPRANAQAMSPGLALTIPTIHGDLRYVVDSYSRWQDNLRAVALSLAALRAVDRYGVTKRGEQYRGWRALESGDGDAARGRELIEQHGGEIAAVKATHPDHGGNDADFRAVQAARGVTR